MAIVNRNSLALRNQYSVPTILNPQYLIRSDMYCAVGAVSAVTGDSVGSVYRLLQISSGCRIAALLLKNDGSSVTFRLSFGLYHTFENGGAVVDASIFFPDYNPNNPNFIPASIFESAMSDELLVWQFLGLPQDPNLMYDVALTVTADCDVGQGFSLQAFVTSNN